MQAEIFLLAKYMEPEVVDWNLRSGELLQPAKQLLFLAVGLQ